MSTARISPSDDARVVVEELQEIGAGLDLITDQLARNQREQTAATILAALMRPELGFSPTLTDGDRSRVSYATNMADALRAELTKGSP